MAREPKGNYLIPKSLFQFPWPRFPSIWESDELEEYFGDHTGLSVSEDDTHVIVEAALPGLKPEDIEVTLDKGILRIQGEKREEEEDKKRKYYRKASHSFSYRVAVPGNIDESQEPVANFDNGMMTISFPKTKETKAKRINVKKK